MEYNQLSEHAKQVVIDLAIKAGYGDSEYTNFDEIDYKFFEDFPHKDSVFILAKKLADANLIASELLRFIQKYYRYLRLDDQDIAEELIKRANELNL